jgi:serine/threonine protein kinase
VSAPPDRAQETLVQRRDAATLPGLPPSLVGCFQGDPKPAPGLFAEDAGGALDLALPFELFSTADGRAPSSESAPGASFSRAADAAAVTAGPLGLPPGRPAEGRASSREPSLPAIGSVIEKYRIEELLGTGGFAAVYRATHLLLRIPVAIKLLKPKVLMQRPLLAELLCEEARFAAQLNHPNVVRVFDVTHNSKITYIVMEHIDGESLHQTIGRKGRLPPRRVLRIGIHVTLGLKAALDQGLIHRDIKPANILLARNGATKIVDLGLAQHSDDIGRSRDPEAAKLVVGTPTYMAPEQAMRPEEVDFRADIYALGATLYHAVVGRPPFEDKDPLKVLSMHQNQPVPPPEDLAPGVPFELSRILLWMLQKDRADRPDYDQLLEGLQEAEKVMALEDGIEGLVK